MRPLTLNLVLRKKLAETAILKIFLGQDHRIADRQTFSDFTRGVFPICWFSATECLMIILYSLCIDLF